jgi:hypothetical protein
VSFDISYLTVKSSRPFTEGNFVKNCMLVASEELCCTNCVKEFESVSLNWIAVQRQIADISKDVETQFSEVFNKCVYFSLAVDESMDITLATQMCIFACGVTSDFEVFEELADLHSMQSQKKGSDFMWALLCVFRSIILNYLSLWYSSNLCHPLYDGSNNGMVSLLCKHVQGLGLQNELT